MSALRIAKITSIDATNIWRPHVKNAADERLLNQEVLSLLALAQEHADHRRFLLAEDDSESDYPAA